MIKLRTLPECINFCATIGNLPSSYMQSLTYEEQILWLCKFLETEVLPAFNNNTAAVEELQNWFNNLDVQEEINNKLNEMVESGQLQEIISEYLNSTAVFGFDTVADMQSATNLIDGSYAKTLGYNEINDGGSGTYKIRTITNEDVVDGGSIIAMNDGSLIAELIVLNDINFIQFGAKGDGVTDDIIYINKALNYAKNNSVKLTSPKDKVYLVSNTVDLSTLFVDFNNATIKASDSINVVTIDSNSDVNYTNINNLVIDCNNIATIGLNDYSSRRSNFNNINILNVYGKGILITYGFEKMYNNINMQSSNDNTIGFEILKGDSHFNNIHMTNIKKAFIIKSGSNIFTNIHCWISESELVDDSVLFDINLSSNLENTFTNIYSDTYQYTFKYETGTSVQFTNIDGLIYRLNSEIYTSSNNDSYLFHCPYVSITRYININNAFIVGLLVGGNSKTYFTNQSEFRGNVSKIIQSNCHYIESYSLTNVNSALTVETNSITVEDDLVTLDFVASYDSSAIIGDSSYINQAGKFPDWLNPDKAITNVCIISDSRWNFYQTETGYLYLSGSSEQNRYMNLRLPSGSSTKYIFVHIVYKRTSA